MRFSNLYVENFKAVDSVALEGLQDVVVIAGPNGCGKSTILDAVRLWKSAIGAYQRDELRVSLQELGFSESTESLKTMLQTPTRSLAVTATVDFASNERRFLRDNVEQLLSFYFFRQRASDQMMRHYFNYDGFRLSDDFRTHSGEIWQSVHNHREVFLQQVSENSCVATMSISPTGDLQTNAPFLLNVYLSMFLPPDLGIIDYYGPQRAFGRETVGGITLQVRQQRAQQHSSALYQTAGKVSNIKSELASSFVNRLLAEAATGQQPDHGDIALERTVHELFQRFIPGKTFDGLKPTADGGLTFDVSTPAGKHDIAELSSGEKELIYGYLRLRNSERRNSIIMIDEPELHLNPRLTDGLPHFYSKHFGSAFNNQLWLITHSDTILRQSVAAPGFSVYHMQTAGSYPEGSPQATQIVGSNDVDRAIIDLVGDLAAYKPRGKLVLLEGGGDSEFDASVVTKLFPDFASRVNLISSDNRSRVRKLHSVLHKVATQSGLFHNVASITDRDMGYSEEFPPPNSFTWDCYHIENYLLEPTFIRAVLIELNEIKLTVSELDIYNWLRESARARLDELVRHDVESWSSRLLRNAVRVNTPRDTPFMAIRVVDAAKASVDRCVNLLSNQLSPEQISMRSTSTRETLTRDLGTDEWRSTFRGRDILKEFASRHCQRVTWDVLRDLVLGKMQLAEYQPVGMARILNAPACDSV
ncbi:AAA15 family ATPase/GTPase [Sphingomonas jinjuensis]|uniref:AAA15 family ATPase/GTPase n=1 Tax=Sphingomonas jinjuensis TaxID=535907 RepID=A0A840FBM9_9SPHN|nr:AAA family ATPase [Sphingomonas jinjuensis]MBB4152947.1 AAA15 family ATPase/GTPase [Sphingomonas jinjuensis]